MRISLVRNSSIFLSALLTASAVALPAFAEVDTLNSAAQQFKLSAQKHELPQLSRAEIDPVAMPQMAPRMVPSKAALSYAPAPAPFGNQAQSPALAGRAQADDDNDPNGFLRERNVDWSKWVSQLADRWYFVLRQIEDGCGGMQFVTQRAALIEFTCYSNGQIGNVILKQSSGNGVYDRLQMIALMQAMPMPAFPAGTKRTSITLLQGWESHIRQPGEQSYVPGTFGRNFPMEKVREWVMGK